MKNYYYKIGADDLRDLLYSAAKLQCLEENGVDNWLGYMDNRESFIASTLNITIEEVEENNLQIQDVADKWIEDYELIK